MLRGDQAYHTYDRLEILRWTDTTLVNGINNLDRKSLVQWLKRIKNDSKLTNRDWYDIHHILSDNKEFLENDENIDIYFHTKDTSLFTNNQQTDKNRSLGLFSKNRYDRAPILKYFYKSNSNFLEHESDNFSVYVNPVIQFSYQNEKNNENLVFQNTRGIDIRGYIDNKVYFYTQLLENQRSYLSFTEQRIEKFSTIPGQGFWKGYNSDIIKDLKGYDFFHARAYIGFQPIKSINIEFGHSNHFLGNGLRSLLLSDYSHNYLFLKFKTKIWKFQYQNIFAELAPTSTLLNPGDIVLPKKYTANHYLAFKPNTKFEIGVFETVIFSRINHFEFQYLNPIILYRAVEHFLDSPDNVILGLNVKWNPIEKISLYGQLVLDEFKLSELRKQTGWWANKFGTQIGLKYINALGIDHLDLQVEYNVVRPYTYSHRDTLPSFSSVSVANYSHSNQPLAHPLGANFKEFLLVARYKPTDRVYIILKGLFTTYGDDQEGQNWGGNILLPNQTRQSEYGNTISQGVKNKIQAINLDMTYEVYQNYFIDVQTMWRQTKVEKSSSQNYVGLGFRVNISNIFYDY